MALLRTMMALAGSRRASKLLDLRLRRPWQPRSRRAARRLRRLAL